MRFLTPVAEACVRAIGSTWNSPASIGMPARGLRFQPAAAALLLASLPVLATPVAAESGLRIDCDFPGGNIIVDRIDGDNVHVHQDLRDTNGWWFYWYFRVRGAERRTLTFHFKDRALGPLGPALSRDAGQTWHWLRQKESVRAYKYTFGADETEVRFSFAMPYQDADLQRFLQRHKRSDSLRVETFARTRNGTPVEWLRLGRFRGEVPFKVWITCRHHACEMMTSYVLEGVVDEVLSDSEAGAWLRRNVDFLIVPMVDKDGVEAGDQGKNRMPHDHAADYIGPSIYPEVAALREYVSKWAGGAPDLTFDLHNPSINHQVIYTHALRDHASSWQNTRAEHLLNARRFLDILEKVQQGPLVFRVQDSIDFAVRKAKESEQATGRAAGGKRTQTADAQSESDRAAAIAEPFKSGGFCSTFEIPYAVVKGMPVDAESARAFGHDIGRALHTYLQTAAPRSR